MNYKTMLLPELAFAFNCRFALDKTPGQIKSTLKNHGFTCGRKASSKGKYTLLNPEQVQFLREEYPRCALKDLAVAMNRKFHIEVTSDQLHTFVKNHKITCGRSGRFEKGCVPWTKGTKGVVKPNSGNFKKGDIPVNLKPIGHERISQGLLLIKVAERNPYTGADGRYRHKHVWLWEQHFGPVPADQVVAFRDGNKLNCTPENLMLISRAELLRLNQQNFRDCPDQIKPSLIALIKLEVKLFKRMKETK